MKHKENYVVTIRRNLLLTNNEKRAWRIPNTVRDNLTGLPMQNSYFKHLYEVPCKFYPREFKADNKTIRIFYVCYKLRNQIGIIQ